MPLESYLAMLTPPILEPVPHFSSTIQRHKPQDKQASPRLLGKKKFIFL